MNLIKFVLYNRRGYGGWWQSGYAADCKSVYAGSIPTSAFLSPDGKIW